MCIKSEVAFKLLMIIEARQKKICVFTLKLSQRQCQIIWGGSLFCWKNLPVTIPRIFASREVYWCRKINIQLIKIDRITSKCLTWGQTSHVSSTINSNLHRLSFLYSKMSRLEFAKSHGDYIKILQKATGPLAPNSPPYPRVLLLVVFSPLPF